MKGQGRVFRPKVRGEETAVWWLDYSVNGRRYREASGTMVKAEALAMIPGRKEDRKIGRPIHDATPSTLAAFVAEHLQAKAREEVTLGWVAESEHQLKRAVEHFGPDCHLVSITTKDVRRWSERLQAAGLAGGTVRHHLNALSNLFKRARAEAAVPSGYDPVGDLMHKPKANPDEALWLEVPEAALLLEAARTTPASPAASGQPPVPFAYELIATLLLTGGRQDEVLGLEVADVDFDRKRVTFRPNAWRRLKTEKSHRTLPLWPQLEAILRPYVFGGDSPPARLLFPSYRTGTEAMLTDVRKLLDRVTERVGTLYLMDQGRRRKADPGDIRTKVFRHTYISARLQTLDRGAPVSTWTVAGEVGHSSTAMIERTYGHHGELRHRAKAVEYRGAQHKAKLGDRLARLWGVRQTIRQTSARSKLQVIARQ